MEKIVKIEEITESDESGWNGKSGFSLTTDTQVIKLLIDNGQCCCEEWGYFMSEDNTDQFVGAEIISITLTDTCLNTKEFDKRLEYGVDCGGCMFVNINTDRGVLQFVAYNSHNGYYGHDAYVISEQLNHEVNL